MPAVIPDKEDSESSSEDEQESLPPVAWCGLSKSIPIFLFVPEAAVAKDAAACSVGERYNMAFKIVRTESRLVREILSNHGFHEVHPNSNDFNLMWTGSHLKSYLLRNLQDFQKVNHFPRSYELTRKDRLYRNIQRMQQTYGFKNFLIVPQTFMLPSEYQDFCNYFAKDKGPWIIKPVASSRGRGIYLVSDPSQISMDENILVSRYISNPLLIDEFKFDMRLYVVVTSYDPLLIYVYEEGLARFATVKYDRTFKSIKNTFMHLTNYSLNKKSSDYVSCDDPDVEDYGNKWSMSAVLRFLKQEGKNTTLLMKQVEDLIIKAVLSAELQIATACKMFVPHKTNCFELYGFDVLIDSSLKPWLLEVNLSPSLACDAPLDLKIKASMIADMLSLVGLVCQDPSSRQARSDRGAPDPKQQRGQKPFSAPSSSTNSRLQRSSSSSNWETESLKDKFVVRQGQGDSTLTLTAEEIKVLRRVKEEYERRGGFIRIFPTAETWHLYSGYLEFKTSLNYMLANRLFHGRSMNGHLNSDNTQHTVQYERKLLTLETRKRRQQHLRKKRSGKDSKTSPPERVEEETEQGSRVLKCDPQPVYVAEQGKQAAGPLGRCHNFKSRPKVDLLGILQQGWDMSKVQARVAFSSYLQRVQLRLLAESRANSVSAWPEKDNDQMELVMRFLRRAASNLQQDMKVVLPHHQLPLQDRRRILSQQLGEFIHRYNEETAHMEEKPESNSKLSCVNASVFEEYISVASESDLEEVLTFYTQKNKSATVFLGTRVRSTKKEASSGQELSEKSRTSEESGTSESSLSPGKADRDSKATESHMRLLSDQQQAAVRHIKTHLGFTYTPTQHSSFQAARPHPHPQPPSYAQSLAKSQFCHTENQSHLPAYSASQPPAKAVYTAVPTLNKVCAGQTTQTLRWIPSTSNAGAITSINDARHVYSQKLCRPTSAGQVVRWGSTGKPKSSPVRTIKDVNPVQAQAQSGHQAFITALQKLTDKQLSGLNLASKMLNREAFTLGSKVRQAASGAEATFKCDKSGTEASHIPSSLQEGLMQSAYGLVSAVDPKHQVTAGSYPLHFAIKQLQQQKCRQQQLVEPSHCQHQVQHCEATIAPVSSGGRFCPQHNSSLMPTCVNPALPPKPPSTARESQSRKTKRLIKQPSQERSASGTVSSSQQMVYEALCGKTGLSVYRTLFTGPEPSHR
ncbi:tubulin polyglutamylase TTLL5 isoform 1-T2 [Synchiropus picturatus]